MTASPPEAQARFHNQTAEQEAERKQQDDEAYLACTDEQRKIADYKEQIVKSYLDFCRMNRIREKQLAFIERWNAENPNEKPLLQDTLGNWVRQYKNNGYAGLVDNRGKAKRGYCSIPQDVQEYFKAL